jgi:Zn-dependent protease
MVLNLLPILPLDGGRIVVSLAPHRLAWRLSQLEPYGFPLLLVLLFTGVLNAILWPGVAVVMAVLAAIFGLR